MLPLIRQYHRISALPAWCIFISTHFQNASIQTSHAPHLLKGSLVGFSVTNALIACPLAPLFLLRLVLLLPELRNLQFHVLVHSLLQFRAVAEEEQNLHPDKQRRQQQGLHEVIEQCRGPPFERPVPDELRQPRHHVNTPGVVVHNHAVSTEEIIAGGCGADHQRRDQTTRDGFEEHIKDGVDERTDRAGIGREVVDVQGIGNGEEWWAVACLDSTRQL